MLDLDAYLERIGLGGRPSLQELHRAHGVAIPFENLDPHRGVPVSLAQEDLERKLVTQRRGGYCFEQNLLLKSALEALGAEVDLMLARVRLGASPDLPRPRSHLVLRVREAGREWHADVGFGLGTLLEPLPFGPGDEHEQGGWRFKVVADRHEYVLQTDEGDGWVDLYGFPVEAVPRVDVETANWWTSTHPHSPFVTGLILSTHDVGGGRISLSDWSGLALTERTPSSRRVTPVQRTELPRLIAERFGLSGFAVGEDGRVLLSRG